MVGALWTGISGLSGSQMGLDNESNNIANVNTIGYKASRVSFADQMYQDSIGKGVTSQDVEKMYKQGSLKLTGVSYDMALAGNGFFQVSDGLDTYYTRAGNFRMGESGALEDVGAKRVQGWAMKTVTTDDINSTDSNTTYFTNDFTKILGNQVIRDATSIDTVVTKATDYTQTASSDSLTIFSGAGYKSASTKISDIELLMSEYNSALIQYAKAEPKPLSSTSSTQSDLMNFDIGSKTLAEGDEVYVHIDGVKYTQSFDTDNATTMKKFSDVLSDTAGFNSYLTGDDTSPYDLDTQTAPEKGIVILEGLVPGSQYRITEFGWTDASNSNSVSKGVVESIKTATKGTGMGHIESLEAVMADLVAGKQMDVYDDITLGGSNFTYQIDVYNKELDTNEIIPTAPLSIASPVTVDDIVAGINANTTATGELADYVKAYNINGSLVIKTLDSNSDVEFVGTLKGDVAASATSASSEVNTINFNADADANGGAFDVTINGTVYPTTIAAADTQAQMAVKVAASINDALDLAPDNTIESVVANGNAVVITYTIDALGTGTSSVSNNTAVTSTTPTIAIATQSQSSTTTVGEKDLVTFSAADADGGAAMLSVDGVDYTTTVLAGGAADTVVAAAMKVAIEAGINETDKIQFSNGATGNVVTLNIHGIDYTHTVVAGAVTDEDIALAFKALLDAATGNDDVYSSVTTDGSGELTITYDKNTEITALTETSDTSNLAGAVNNSAASGVSSVTDNGDGTLTIEYNPGEVVTPIADVTVLGGDDADITTTVVNTPAELIEVVKDSDFSGREGAGAEFLKITTTINQLASKSDIQLRLDTLNLTDSAFGEFEVDETGLITMQQDGATFAVGQVAVAQFTDNRGLDPAGDNLLKATSRSGAAIFNTNNDKAAEIKGATLELSTADLSESLVNLMVFQRAFEANAKSITTADQILTTLIQLKR